MSFDSLRVHRALARTAILFISTHTRSISIDPSQCKGVNQMGLLRTGLAGAAAWKWGGGIFGTIIVFVLAYWLLGIFFR